MTDNPKQLSGQPDEVVEPSFAAIHEALRQLEGLRVKQHHVARALEAAYAIDFADLRRQLTEANARHATVVDAYNKACEENERLRESRVTDRDRLLALLLMERGSVGDPRLGDLRPVDIAELCRRPDQEFFAKARQLTDEEVEAALKAALGEPCDP